MLFFVFCFSPPWIVQRHSSFFPFIVNSNVNLLSYNVNGLRQETKRSKVISRLLFPLNKPAPDIFCFQETHSQAPDVMKWASQMGGSLYFSHGTNLSRGVLIGIKRKLPHQVLASEIDPQGRYVALNLTILGEPVTLIGTYFEPDIVKPELDRYYDKLMLIVAKFGNNSVVWCGDFNTNLDVITPRKWKEDTLRSLMDAHELTDVWRVSHPDQQSYSLFTHRMNSLSRPDLWLASPCAMTRVTSCEIGLAYCSDHAPVFLNMDMSSNPSGNGFFRLPNFLVYDPDFREKVRALVTDQLTLNKDSVSDSVLWDSIKASIRGLAIGMLCHYKQSRKKKIERIEHEIFETIKDRDRNANNPDMVGHYTAKVKFLQIELDDVYEALSVSSRQYNVARKYYHLNRSSKYHFCRYQVSNDSIKRIENHSGRMVTSDSEILQVAHKHYDMLFLHRSSSLYSEAVEGEFIQRLPRLTTESVVHKRLAAPLSMAELYQALCGMKGNTSPGLDSLTVEFYRVFWNDVKELVYKSIQESFQEGRMSISQRQGVIRLIPKKNRNLLQIQGWRPITLLCVDFKLVTKSLSTRLASILPDLLHTDQKGFVKGRFGGENILDVYALIAQVDQLDEEFMLIFLDIEKAFDSVSWSFLNSVLKRI